MLPDRPGELAPRSYWSHVDGFLEVMLGRSEPGESTRTNVVSPLSSYLMSVSAFISKIKDEKSTMKTSVAQLQEEEKKTRRKKCKTPLRPARPRGLPRGLAGDGFVQGYLADDLGGGGVGEEPAQWEM